MITAIELDYEQLSMVLDGIGVRVHAGFLYPTFWKFIILTEIARSIMAEPARWTSPRIPSQDMLRIEQAMAEFEQPLATDFSSRIMDKLVEIRARAEQTSLEETRSEIEGLLGKSRLYRLEDSLVRFSKVFRIHVAIDDIDKRWDPKFDASVAWIRGLLDEMSRMRRHFQSGLRSTLFLRLDMFQHLKLTDIDFANRSTALLRWDGEQLRDMIAARIEFLSGERFSTVQEAWSSVFDSMIEGKTTSDYLIERTLMRPRDLIQFCQLALEQAQFDRVDRISSLHVLAAEGDYSRYLFEAVRTEFLQTYPFLGHAMREFHGSTSRDARFQNELERSQVALSGAGANWGRDGEEIARVLFEVGFLGIGKQGGSECAYSWAKTYEEARRSSGDATQYRVHPGFHSYLEIADDPNH